MYFNSIYVAITTSYCCSKLHIFPLLVIAVFSFRFHIAMAQQKSRKRLYEEIDHIADLDRAIPNTCIHGAITSISPIKRGRSAPYFDGMLADETSKIRVVGFETLQQKKLSDYHQRNIPIQLVNCEVKAARRGEGYDVLLTSHTKIIESPTKFDAAAVTVAAIDTPVIITLDQLPTIDNFQKVQILSNQLTSVILTPSLRPLTKT